MGPKHRWMVSVTVGAALVPLAFVLPLGLAGATPGSGASTSITARGSSDQPIHIHAKRSTDVVFARVTLQPDGYTGWHTHPGPLVVVVQSGTLTHYDRRCRVHTYTAGQAFHEPAGRRYVHMGTNQSSVPVVLDVTYLVPAGGPLRDEAPPPACAASQPAATPTR